MPSSIQDYGDGIKRSARAFIEGNAHEGDQFDWAETYEEEGSHSWVCGQWKMQALICRDADHAFFSSTFALINLLVFFFAPRYTAHAQLAAICGA